MNGRPRPAIDHPSPSLAFNAATLAAGTILHRIHHERWAPTGFNPGAPIDPAKGVTGSRFAPFQSGGNFIPTLYAGDSLGVAAFETVFHNIDPRARFKTVSMSQLSPLVYSVVTVTADIEVTRLFEPDLKKIALTRRDLIDCPESEYPRTRPWATAIYESLGEPAGMIWTSRQFDEGRACMLFGRPGIPAPLDRQSSVSIVNDAGTLEALRKLGEIAGVTVVHS